MTKLDIGWDSETYRFRPGCGAPRMVCASFDDGTRADVVLREEGLDRLELYLKNKENLIAHHAPYDFGVACAEREHLLTPVFEAIERGDVTDTIIREKMMDNAKGHLKFEWDPETEEYKRNPGYELGTLVYKRLGIYLEKPKKDPLHPRLRFSELDGIPVSEWPEKMPGAEHYPGPEEYSIEDSTYARNIWRSQEDEVAPEGIPHEASEVGAAWGLHLMHLWGVRTDPVAVAVLKGKLRLDFEAQKKLCQTAKYVRPDGSKDMAKIRAGIEKAYAELGRDYKLTPKEQIATDREQLKDSGDKGLIAIAEMGRLQKQLTTYIPVLEGGVDVPINCSYNSIIETFRTSCRKPNLQNIGRKGGVRDCFVARPGYVFVFCDYDSLEMRTLAQVCIWMFGYSTIADAIAEGLDPHVDFAADMLGISYRECLERYEAGDPLVDALRQGCKIANYGMAGGMGPHTFVEYAKGFGHVLPMAESRKLHEGFRRKWREMREYFDHWAFMAREGNFTQEFPGTGLIRGDVNYTAANNGPFQHLAAKGAKEAVWRVAKECYTDAGSPLYGCRPWLFAHDEIGMEVPYEAFGPKKSSEATTRLKDVMEEAMKKWVPDVVIGASAAMTRRWFKGAKAVKQNGIIVPVKPEKKGDKTIWVPDQPN